MCDKLKNTSFYVRKIDIEIDIYCLYGIPVPIKGGKTIYIDSYRNYRQRVFSSK